MDIDKDAGRVAIESTQLLAFETSAIGTRCIVFAANAGKARAATVRAATDAGYGVTFADVRVRRARQFDDKTKAWGAPIKPQTCYGTDAFVSEANAGVDRPTMAGKEAGQ